MQSGPITLSKIGCPDLQTANFTVIICPPITLAPATLPNGATGTAYSQTLTASGGTAPYTFTVTAGNLPVGLMLSASGTLSGTPLLSGASTFTVTATDANGCTGTRSYTVNVSGTTGTQAGFLYVLKDSTSGNQIYGYAVNETTGALALLPGFPSATGINGFGSYGSEQLTIDRVNQRLYALNSYTISAYAINPVTGALTPMPFSPINLGSGNWYYIAVHPGGSPLLVGERYTTRLLSYQITATTATAVPGSPYNTGSPSNLSTAFSQDGRYVYTGGDSINSNFAGFSVTAGTGVLTALVGSPFDSGNSLPTALATDAAGRLFVANFQAGQVRVFTTASGIPSAVSGNPFASGLNVASHGLLHPNGFYFVADYGTVGVPPGNRVGVYRINGSGSATTLTAVPGSPFAASGILTNVLALNQAGTFLFAANGDTRNLTTFSVNPITGVLTALGTQPANTMGTSGRLIGMAYLPLSTQCPTITLSPTTLLGGTVNTVYNQTVTASPAGSYTYAVTAGALPAGLSLNSATGAITGTPTTAGTTTFTITATGAGGCTGSQAYSLTITSTPCTYTIAPTTQSFGSTGGTGTVTITTGSTCVWVATPDVDWITILASKSGTGSDTLRYDVARNTSGQRIGTITIAGQKLTITQAGTLANVNAASYVGGMLAQESIVSAFGIELTTAQQSAMNLPLPTIMAGTTVRVKDSTGVERFAPLFYVSPGQVNYQIPPGTALGTAIVTITSSTGMASAGTVQITLVGLGIFSANADGTGPVVGSAIRVKNGVIIAEEPLARYDPTLQKIIGVPLDVSRPEERVVIQIYGTGIRFRSSQSNVVVTIGGVNVMVEYADKQPNFVGLDQLNLVVPATLSGRGEVDIVVIVDGKPANIVTITIK